MIKKIIHWVIIGILIVVALIFLSIGLSSSGCSYKATFYIQDEEVGRIESKAKGKYHYEKGDIKMDADFGKPIIDLSGLSLKKED